MESIIKTLDADLDMLAKLLPELKRRLSLQGHTSSDIWQSFTFLSPHIGNIVKVFEDTFGKLDFNHLDLWFKQIEEGIRQYKQQLEHLSKQGIDMRALSIQDLQSDQQDILEKVTANDPRFKMMPSLFGPNWQSQTSAIIRLSGLGPLPVDKQIPLKDFKPRIDRIARNIFDLWSTLRRLENEGRVRYFKEQWDKLQLVERDIWLQQFSDLHQCPNSAIYMLAQYPKVSPDKAPFLTPLLNREDLAQANVLPGLLQTRSTIHPKMFLSADTRFVDLAHWYQLHPFAKMQVQGRVSFFPGISNDKEYGLQYEPDAFKKLHLTNPVIGIQRLTAQQKMYSFLVSCLSAQLEPSVDPTASTRKGNCDEPLSLLCQSALQQYARPDCIDWENLAGILSASAKEAVDDLLELRNNPEYWHIRFTEMERNASNFLRSVFGRIDIFHTIYEKLRDCRNDRHTSFSGDLSAIQIPCDDARITGAISMHSALRSILNEMLSSLQGNAWLSKETENSTLLYLFGLIKENDPTIRLMGFDTVLRTIERELPGANPEEAPPFSIAQVFHDMSVVAACMQETIKHYNLVLNLDDKYCALASDATSEWQERERPWVYDIEIFLKEIGRTGNEFNKEARDEKTPLEDRHRTFWNRIDDCMRKWNSSSLIVSILDQAPVPRASASTISESECGLRYTSYTDSTPTETRLKKSQRRLKSPVSLPVHISSITEEPRSRPTIHITTEKDIAFWYDLLNEKGQKPFEAWSQFLQSIGFKCIMQGGAGRRFELNEEGSHAIIYHDLHGTKGNKVPHRLARSLWAFRLEKHFNVIVSAEGATVLRNHQFGNRVTFDTAL